MRSLLRYTGQTTPARIWLSRGGDATAFGGVVVAIALVGCASLTPAEQARSTSLTASPASRLRQTFDPLLAPHAGRSGVMLLDRGREDFIARIAAIDLAERSIDVQTYLWMADDTGRLLVRALLAAANRGVRVRLLIDDGGTGGHDSGLRALDAHANVDVRVYNPYVTRGAHRLWEQLTRFARIDRRMHNKSFIVDGELAVVGGRNIGDAYFGASRSYNLRDLDLLAVGPAVHEIARSFDDYWNSRWAYPIAAVGRRQPQSAGELAARWRGFAARVAAAARSYPYALAAADARATLERLRDRLIWAPVEVAWDSPSKTASAEPDREGRAARAYLALAEGVRRELFEVSAYFVPRFHRHVLDRLRARGVTVRVLTNSLESTDSIAAQAGYAHVRAPLLRRGVELHELRADAASRTLHGARARHGGRLGLHAKVAVYDRETVSIGSFNIDARSTYLNTELIVVVHSSELAAQTLAVMAPDLAADSSWRVTLGPRGGVVWSGLVDGRSVETSFEPAAPWRALAALFFSFLPRGQL